MIIYPACWPTPDQQRTLTKAGRNDRLISYFYLRNKRPDPGVDKNINKLPILSNQLEF